MSFLDRLNEPGTINGILTIIGAALAIGGFAADQVSDIVGYIGAVITGLTGLYNTFRERDEQQGKRG